VALADEFAEILIKEKLSPIDGIKHFLSDRPKLLKFDPEMIRSLVNAFIKEDSP